MPHLEEDLLSDLFRLSVVDEQPTHETEDARRDLVIERRERLLITLSNAFEQQLLNAGRIVIDGVVILIVVAGHGFEHVIYSEPLPRMDWLGEIASHVDYPNVNE